MMKKAKNQVSITIEPFEKEDYFKIRSWWSDQKEAFPPPASFMPEESTFVVRLNGKLCLSASVYLTNVPIAWVDNFVGNPKMKSKERLEASHRLLEFLNGYAKDRGYAYLFCLSTKPATNRLYRGLGFKKSCEGMTSFTREIN